MAEPTPPLVKSRGYVFTLNNYTENDLVEVQALAETARYLIFGREVGESGTPHLQGFVYYSNARSWRSVKKYLKRAHIKNARGSPQQNIDYCSKQGNVQEFGDRPKMGDRTDIEECKIVVQQTSSMKAVVEVARSLQGVKMAEMWLKYKEEPRNWKPEVRWYYGPTGAGKTKAAREWLGENIYTTLDTGKWWEGYDGHENVLIDDFRKDFCKFHELLKLLDRYEYRVEVKGSSRQLRAKKIAITAPYKPSVVYETREDVGQLLRRIDKVFYVENFELHDRPHWDFENNRIPDFCMP